jgi:hypothetical protein|tara:strand:+ start:1675 stop:1776 length:102 start_codon:yes stop_codon:yes gene_type:complete
MSLSLLIAFLGTAALVLVPLCLPRPRKLPVRKH